MRFCKIEETETLSIQSTLRPVCLAHRYLDRGDCSNESQKAKGVVDSRVVVVGVERQGELNSFLRQEQKMRCPLFRLRHALESETGTKSVKGRLSP
jgi:hypothetical protein